MSVTRKKKEGGDGRNTTTVLQLNNNNNTQEIAVVVLHPAQPHIRVRRQTSRVVIGILHITRYTMNDQEKDGTD